MMCARGSSRERSKHIITSLSQDGDDDIDVKRKSVAFGEYDQTLEQNSVHLVPELYDKCFETCHGAAYSFPDVDIKNKRKCQEFLNKVEQTATCTIQCTVREICDPRTSAAEVEKAAVGDANMGITVTGGTFALAFQKVLGIQMISKEGKCCSHQEQRKCFPPLKQILQTCFEVRHIVALIFLAFFVQVSFADPVYNKTLQELPVECMVQIKLMQECPKPDVLYMTNLCCADFPGTDLHCQQAEAGGFVTWVFPACIKAQKVGGGLSVKLVISDTVYPDLEFIECLGWDGDRMSYEVLEPCIPINTKIDCRLDKGRQMLCSGGGTQDDKCVCAPEYEPANWPVVYDVCLEGFDSNDPWCECVYKPCRDGHYRNITIPLKAACISVTTAFNYTCIPIPNSTLMITAPDGTKEIADVIVTTELSKINTSSDVIATTEQSKIDTSSDIGNKTNDDHVGLGVVLGLCGVALLLVGFLIYSVRQKKCIKSNTASHGTSKKPERLEITDDFESDDMLLK